MFQTWEHIPNICNSNHITKETNNLIYITYTIEIH